MNRSRVLLLAPHPDDEVVGFAARIGRARQQGSEIFVLTLTEGMPAALVLWPWQRAGRAAGGARRRAEALEAARLLAVHSAGFLPVPSRGLKDHLPEAHAAVAEAVTKLDITTLWVPAYEGGHQDHDAASALAARFRSRLAVFEAPLYGYAGGRVLCQSFVDGDESQADVIHLTPEEQAFKARLLEVYASERANLGYVGQRREALRPQPSYDYSQPPHPGRTFYQRFQWVPFRHPRVDFTTPEEVCRVIACFG